MKRRKRCDPTIQRLTGQLIRASEDERRRIARELHDDIGQRLSLIAVQLGALERRHAGDASGCEIDLADALRELDSLITDVHDLSHNLHSSKLEHLGLESALADVCSTVSQRHGIQVDLRSEGVPGDLDREIALCFYRVGQEALSNVVKHSGSSRALINVASHGEILRMEVIDFGRGFDLPLRDAGLGLITMEERLLAVGGAFSIASRPGFGTTIKAEAPVRRA